jgi:hypothetical protein
LFFYGDIEMKMKIIFGLLGFASLVAASVANAATLSLDPSSATVAVGDSFSVNVLGSLFPTDGVAGGGLVISYDSTLLSLGSYSLNDFPLDFSPGNDVAGALTLVLNAAFTGAAPATGTGTFNFVTLNFTAIAGTPGTAVDLTVDVLNPFVNAVTFAEIPVDTLNGATVTVGAVPVPAAVWLFGSGLLGLVGVARRRQTLAA